MNNTHDELDVIHIYLVKVPDSFSAKADFLPEPQRSKALAFSGKRLTEFVVGRMLISHALGSKWLIQERKRRGPIAVSSENKNQRYLSVSHSNGWLGVALATPHCKHEIGFDIEKIRTNWSPQKATLFCNNQQIAEGFALSSAKQDLFFTTLWSQQEAYFKATQNSAAKADFQNNHRMQTKQISDHMIVTTYAKYVTTPSIYFCDLILDEMDPHFTAPLEFKGSLN